MSDPLLGSLKCKKKIVPRVVIGRSMFVIKISKQNSGDGRHIDVNVEDINQNIFFKVKHFEILQNICLQNMFKYFWNG